MNSLFNTGAKLLGLSQFFLAITVTIQAISLHNSETATAFIYVLPVILLAISFILIFKTEWLATITRVSSDQTISISSRSLLKIGIVLIGLNIFISKIYFVFGLVLYLTSHAGAGIPLKSFFGDFTPLVLSVFLIFGSEQIIRLLEKSGTKLGN